LYDLEKPIEELAGISEEGEVSTGTNQT